MVLCYENVSVKQLYQMQSVTNFAQSGINFFWYGRDEGNIQNP